MDSRPGNWEHIHRVQELVGQVIVDLLGRAHRHDQSKLVDPEVEAFDRAQGLKDLTYDSPEYHEARRGLGTALDHHYAVNDHHPEHHAGGIADMNLVQLIEMLADWKAATERHADGDLRRSIVQNRERFKYGAEMELLLLKTAEDLGWT